jgi:hypothetical protein
VNAAVTNYKDRFKDNPKHFKMLVTTAKYNEDGYATRLAKFKEKNDILDAKIEKVEELRKSEEAKKAAELRAEKQRRSFRKLRKKQIAQLLTLRLKKMRLRNSLVKSLKRKTMMRTHNSLMLLALLLSVVKSVSEATLTTKV